eukprot:CAMPEP_0174381060 /NCGR_PEP_ID=MMETSP0811_2-20130205/123773_1 /TAXON_ID=73025 ORGANISM="Eutreptiella gymnastica-like, Strain CCMP1594" /NCGR_SAMPLE_ID=MMETSP0811_2 /ASSEMBLY_ACC=CAM_ASM_000667 /LENGTH=230 /DNA_ID=CAMNT_0015534103 /DNA_START=428 /DNA_END=1120 /DNA_ORIENTATION=-
MVWKPNVFLVSFFFRKKFDTPFLTPPPKPHSPPALSHPVNGSSTSPEARALIDAVGKSVLLTHWQCTRIIASHRIASHRIASHRIGGDITRRDGGRPCVQSLTSSKAQHVVWVLGGPLPAHAVFLALAKTRGKLVCGNFQTAAQQHTMWWSCWTVPRVPTGQCGCGRADGEAAALVCTEQRVRVAGSAAEICFAANPLPMDPVLEAQADPRGPGSCFESAIMLMLCEHLD